MKAEDDEDDEDNARGRGKGKDTVTLGEGILCIKEVGNIKNVSSDPDGRGNTLIFKEGDFAGVSLYAPASDVTISGNSGFEIDGISCYGFVARSFTFNGNVKLSAECDQENNTFTSSGGKPYLIR